VRSVPSPACGEGQGGVPLLHDSRDIIRRLQRDGIDEVSVGLAPQILQPRLKRVVIVPHPRKDIPLGRCVRFTSRPVGTKTEMPHYIALIHKDRDSAYGVSFPDLPGVITAGDTIDEAMRNAADALEFAADDWSKLSGQPFPAPRTIDDLRADIDFRERADSTVIAAVPFRAKAEAE
jgi:antitoxin HicB